MCLIGHILFCYCNQSYIAKMYKCIHLVSAKPERLFLVLASYFSWICFMQTGFLIKSTCTNLGYVYCILKGFFLDCWREGSLYLSLIQVLTYIHIFFDLWVWWYEYYLDHTEKHVTVGGLLHLAKQKCTGKNLIAHISR